ATRLEPGKSLKLHKMVAYGWSSERSAPALRDQVDGALASAKWHGWDAICADQKAYLDDFWGRADVEMEGDGELQQALRFAMFHVLQSAARAEGRAVPAKGLTGPGYDGHTFWDAESFVLRALTYTTPSAVRDALTWRQSILPLARDRARVLGLGGVTGPDEYSALEDNNVYTSLMAQRNMQAAADAVERHSIQAAKLGAGAEEAASWRDAAASMHIPFDEALNVHPQAEGFTRYQVWDFERTPPDHYPLLLYYPYFDLNRKQAVKQADLVLALELRG